MHAVLIGIGPVFLVLFFGLVIYTNHRRRTWMPAPQAQSPQPQPSALSRPGWFKMVAPSRATKILFGVAASLVVAGFLVVIIIANLDHSRPIPLPLLIIVIALVGSGGLIVGGLALAAFLRQSKAGRPEGWPPG